MVRIEWGVWELEAQGGSYLHEMGTYDQVFTERSRFTESIGARSDATEDDWERLSWVSDRFITYSEDKGR